MIKYILLILLSSIFSCGAYGYDGSTMASVVIAGGVIKAQNVDVVKKYRRKDCPVCEGRGWYISGDKITKVNCGYCEPEKEEPGALSKPEKVVVHPPIVIKQNCPNGYCTPQSNRRR